MVCNLCENKIAPCCNGKCFIMFQIKTDNKADSNQKLLLKKKHKEAKNIEKRELNIADEPRIKMEQSKSNIDGIQYHFCFYLEKAKWTRSEYLERGQ